MSRLQRAGAGLVALRTARTHPQTPVRVAVSAVTDLTPSMRQVTFTGGDFPDLGLDQYARLLLPRRGRLELPSSARWYPELLAMDPAVRPWLRNYTLRAVRPGEVDVDFHLHDGTGPTVSWVRSAAVGDEVGLIEQGAPLVLTGEPLLVVADDTGLPAAMSILQARPDATAVLEVEHPQPTHGAVTWVSRGEAVAAVAALDGAPGQAWIAGEAAMVVAARRLLVSRGWPRSAIRFSGYYRKGRAQY